MARVGVVVNYSVVLSVDEAKGLLAVLDHGLTAGAVEDLNLVELAESLGAFVSAPPVEWAQLAKLRDST